MRGIKLLAGISIALLVASACGDDNDDSIPAYDSSKPNISVKGTIGDLTLAVSTADDKVIQSEREYRGPPAEGTDPAEEIPDVTQTRLCEIEVVTEFSFDGTRWAFEFEFENFDPDSFGVGTYEVIAAGAPTGPGKTSIELQMESVVPEGQDPVLHEKTAISGTVEVKTYSSTGTNAENDKVVEGGEIGGTFKLTFGPNETMEGTFHSSFGENDIAGKDC